MKTIEMSGVIGWDVTAEDIRKGLDEANGGDVEILVSSPGGLVSAALEMFNMIRNYPGQITARLVGYAMSAASYIPLAADKIIAEDNAVYMIHNVHGGVWGDHNYILKYGGYTKDLSRMLARAYVKFTGKPESEISEMMDNETYFFGSEITDNGFAHETAGTENDDDATSAMAVARTAFGEVSNKMAANITTVTDDLARAMAMAPPTPDKHRATAPTSTTTQEPEMDLKTLKEKYPDLVAAIIDETTAAAKDQIAADIDAARKEGAAAEAQRAADVRSQSIPGHEELIETMAADGQSTAADAALAIVTAEKALRKKAVETLEGEANATVHPTADPGKNQVAMKRQRFNTLQPADQAAHISAGGTVTD